MIKAIIAAALLIAGTTSLAAADAPAMASETTTAQPLTEGEVRKVDQEQKKITIKHGEIANLDMPPMTMVFKVSDSAMLATVKPGDKIRFSVEKRPEGFFVTRVLLANSER